MRFNLLLWCCCLSVFTSEGQSSKFNVGVDLFPNYIIDLSSENDSKSKPSISLGIVMTYQLSKSFSLESGVSYVNRGYSEILNIGYFDQNSTNQFNFEGQGEKVVKSNFNYLSIPLNVRFTLGAKTNEGWYVRFGLAGEYFQSRGDSHGEFFYKKDGSIYIRKDETDRVRKVGLSFNFGVGYSFLINKVNQISLEPVFNYLPNNLFYGSDKALSSIGVKLRYMIF